MAKSPFFIAKASFFGSTIRLESSTACNGDDVDVEDVREAIDGALDEAGAFEESDFLWLFEPKHVEILMFFGRNTSYKWLYLWL